MPRRKLNESVRHQFFHWRLIQRGGVWYADGRSNEPSPGRHSLGTKNREEAMDRLRHLDRTRAEDLGLVARSRSDDSIRPLSLDKGRKLFDDHNARPPIVGGVKKSTQKRYRAIFDKFLPFLKTNGITDWNGVTERTLEDYAAHLTDQEYAAKTIFGELTTVKTAFKWLCENDHLNREPLKLQLKKAECQRAYCYTQEQVVAMIAQCIADPELTWILNAIIGLACTGMRIEELASLKWSDIRFDERNLTIADESGFAINDAGKRTTKNSKSRSLPIKLELLEVLRSIPRQDQYVFHGPRGGRLKPDTLRNCLVRDVIDKLKHRWPKQYEGQQSFEDGRLHSFRHYFCSVCANTGVPERIVMEWLGHSDSEMVRHYYHLHDEESRRKMDQLDLLGEGGGRSAAGEEQNLREPPAERSPNEQTDTRES